MIVLYFLATIVLLVAIHEWGHFITARLFGVGVRTFTIGFGNQIVSWVDPKTGTSWGIAPYPLGGYVGLLGEKETATNNIDTTNTSSRNMSVVSTEIAITGKPFMMVPLYAKLIILFSGPFINLLFAAILYGFLAYTAPNSALPVLATPIIGSPVQLAGIQSGDTVVQLNGQSVRSWRDLQMMLLVISPNEAFTLQLLNKHNQIQSIALRMPLINDQQTPEEILGMRLATDGVRIKKVSLDSSSAKAGLQSDDVILSVGSLKIIHPEVLLDALKNYDKNSGDFSINVKRQQTYATVNLKPQLDAQGNYKIGVQFEGIFKLSNKPLTFIEAINEGINNAYIGSLLTLKAFKLFLLKPFKSNQLAGPITIAQTAKASVDEGWVATINFIAGLSISVGVLNLLPVPMLDGGQMIYHTIRKIAITSGAIQTFDTKIIKKYLNNIWASVGIAFVLFITVIALITDFRKNLLI